MQAIQVSVKLKYKKVQGRKQTCSAITGISTQQRDHLNLILNNDQKKTIKGTDQLVQFPGGRSYVKGGSWDYFMYMKKVSVTGLKNERGPKAR